MIDVITCGKSRGERRRLREVPGTRLYCNIVRSPRVPEGLSERGSERAAHLPKSPAFPLSTALR